MPDPASFNETTSGPSGAPPPAGDYSAPTTPLSSPSSRFLRRALDQLLQIGPYHIVELIGEGGMGTVYLAERREPVRMRVALKVIKPGMDTREVVARFDAERQALALMNHPNIARVFDAGATADGRPYFVMEFIAGIPITQYCDRNRLTNTERLGLFGQVCQAVQHAHEKGIIHRDIKPSNVLVCMQNGKPVPKIIDFGVAKATQQRLTDETMYTFHGQLIGTIEYMSPEQAEMSNIEIDPRSDVYSLGVVLYELIVGALPFDPNTLRQAGVGEIQRIIREVDPPKPSTRLSTLGDKTGDVASHRRLDVRTLARELRGDLDWITMKALEKDPGRRYATAAALGEDVARYLHHEPVLARPPSVAYKLHKFIRRHRVSVALAALLVIAIVSTTALYVTRQQTASFEEMVKLAQTLLAEGKKAEAESVLARAVEQITKPTIALGAPALAQPPAAGSGRAELEAKLSAIIRLLQLGDSAEAARQIQDVLAVDPRNFTALSNYAVLKRAEFETNGDLRVLDDALAKLDQASQIEPRRPEPWNIRGVLLRHLGRLPESLAAFEKAIAIDPGYSPSYVSIANTLALLGDWQGAERNLLIAAGIPPDPTDSRPWQRWHNLAALQLALDKPAALAAIDKALAARDGRNPHNWLLKARAHLLLKSALDPAKARDAAVRADEDPDHSPPRTRRIIALAALRLGDWEAAVKAATEAVDRKDPQPAYANLILAIAHAKSGRADDCRRHLRIAEATWPKDLAAQPLEMKATIENGLLWIDTLRELHALRAEADAAAASP